MGNKVEIMLFENGEFVIEPVDDRMACFFWRISFK